MAWINVVESLAVIIASLVAVYGIRSWRREMKGRKEYELAEDVLTLFYEAKDKISAIRNPFSWSGEGQTRKENPEETPEQKEAFDRAHIVFERYQRNQETFNRINTLRYRFMTIFGPDKAKPFNDLNKIVSDIHTSATMLGHYWARLNKGQFPKDEKKYDGLIKKIDEDEAVIWAGIKPDPITARVDRVISEIEKICGPILKR